MQRFAECHWEFDERKFKNENM